MSGARPVPKKALGQHFLADKNILGVIENLAELRSDDVVLEIGPGLGVLTTHLADRVSLVHAVEVDRSLVAPLRAALGERTNVNLVVGDAVRLDLDTLEPPPNKLVANLPYNVATPLVVETLCTLPTLHHWCVMVQREVADRFFAEPSTKAYGGVSVLVQLLARRTGFHAVSRTVFRPPPNVDSALVAFSRLDPATSPALLAGDRGLGGSAGQLADVRALVDAAFAHRRKTLANSVSLAGLYTREAVASALDSIGVGSAARAESLRPEQFVTLATALAAGKHSSERA